MREYQFVLVIKKLSFTKFVKIFCNTIFVSDFRKNIKKKKEIFIKKKREIEIKI